MIRILWFLGLVAVTFVSGQADGDDTYTDLVQTAVKDRDAEDGTDAILRFLGFKCPKGHRCLPVLECLPCDYGTYKPDEGSDLCKNCPAGCTTLRKGAESWKECVPKCPPGYEESKCGKTCTKCRAGYYKSGWKNKMCNKCPMNSNWNRNMIGMKKKSQCYQTALPECHGFTGDVILALDASARVSEDNFTRQLQAVNDFIEAFDVTEKDDATRFAVLTFDEQVGEVIHFDDYADITELQNEINGLGWMGSDVSNISGALDYISNNMIYGAGNRYDIPDTLIVVANGMSPLPAATSWSAGNLKHVVEKVFAVGIGYVNEAEIDAIASHDDYTVLVDNTEELARRLPELTKDACELFKTEPEDTVSTTTTLPRTTTQGSGNDRCHQQYGSCTLEEYENIMLTKGLHGTNCQIFCQCSPASTAANGDVTYYWVEHTCSPGTLFDESLPGCVHHYDFSCADTGPSTTPEPVYTTTAEATGTNGCTVHDACTRHDYEVRRLKPLFGTDCKQFCHCAHAEGSAGTDVIYYWAIQTCGEGTLFDESLPAPVCNHESNVWCSDAASSTNMPSQTTSESTTDRCHQRYGSCTVDEYENIRLKRGLNGTNCQIFCQCAHASTAANGDVTYYWVEHTCSPGTLFDESLPGCIHHYDHICTDTGPSTTPEPVYTTTAEATDTIGCTVHDACTRHDYEVKRLKPLFGTDCKQFCHCAHEEGSAGTSVTYYWAIQTCGDGTLFDDSLPAPVCNHESNVLCSDGATTTNMPSPSTNGIASPTTVPPPAEDFCFMIYGTCTQDDHDNIRLRSLDGVSCLTYCHCAPASTQGDGITTYYWEEKDCAPGTIFVQSLGSCNHSDTNTCEDTDQR